ncbi:MAG: hypothetical protein UT38_C0016G0026 [Microgenomates group bacterium GW2011_GWA2_39_19]|nr:MAG: hypothetical protein UT38_C0016G0026 [Microgenomates group bacterium GW2011_GWA2_39_19]
MHFLAQIDKQSLLFSLEKRKQTLSLGLPEGMIQRIPS